MSSQKSAIELLEVLERRLVSLEKEYFSLKSAVDIIKKELNISDNSQVNASIKKEMQTLDFLGMTTADACLKFLEESKKVCTTEEIANNIYSRGINGKIEIKDKTTSSTLSKLAIQGKITKIGRGFWKTKEFNALKISSEHEQL